MTTSAVVQSFLFIHIGVILVVTAYYLFSAALAPGMAARTRACFATRPVRPILLGAVISVPWVIVSLVLLNVPVGALKFLGAALVCLWVLLGLVGGAGVAQHVGGYGAAQPTSWTQTARGGLIITLTWVLPLVGWLGMLPLTLATGIGCLAMSLFARHGAGEPVEAVA